MPGSQLSLTVIIPTLNEGPWIAQCLSNVRHYLPHAEILVVDGGSLDDTIKLAEDHSVTTIRSAKGRGIQMHTAAQQAESEVLLFLHADTQLPSNAEQILSEYFASKENRIATFRLRFNQKSWFLSASAWLTRFDTVFTRFGDQGIAITRDFYHRIGGFPQWPLFEDVELLRIARRQTKIRSLRAAVTTSSRRFEKRGVLSQQWLNVRLLCRFLLGTPPENLANRYRS